MLKLPGMGLKFGSSNGSAKFTRLKNTMQHQSWVHVRGNPT